MTDLGTLGGTYAQATAINNSSFIVGHSQTRPTRAGGGETHAFIYQYLSTFSDGPTSAMTDLGTLGGGYSYATDVNDSNQVVGYSTIDAEGHFHAFLHDGKAMQDLGSLGTPGNKTDQSFGLGVNKSGEVVGYSFLPSADQVAFVFRGGKMWDLNTLIGSAVKEYYLYSAEGINDQGQIIATAFVPASNTFRAVILTPESVVNTK
jgi:probable HAF family extracellular repeat protein